MVQCTTIRAVRECDQFKIRATPKFVRLAQKFIEQEALQALVDELCLYPDRGVLLQGGAGIRKIRWRTGKDNRGKSGGVRVLYYYERGKLIILLITLFRKTDQENITDLERKELQKLLVEFLEEVDDE